MRLSQLPLKYSMALFGLSIMAGGIAQELLHVPGLSLAVASMVLAVGYETVILRSRKHSRQIVDAWPSVIESLESAASAGMSLLEALRDLAETDQLYVAKDFASCCAEIDSGVPIDTALETLKKRLAVACSDFTIEILRLVNRSGSAGYTQSLKSQSQTLREQTILLSEIKAKQGWVIGTAKLAVLAPWIVVFILSLRPENAAIYASPGGTAILLTGLVASALALAIVYRVGNANREIRVFA